MLSLPDTPQRTIDPARRTRQARRVGGYQGSHQVLLLEQVNARSDDLMQSMTAFTFGMFLRYHRFVWSICKAILQTWRTTTGGCFEMGTSFFNQWLGVLEWHEINGGMK